MPEDVRDLAAKLDAIAEGFIHAQILFTGVRSGVFQHLGEPRSASEVADALGWDERGARMLLDGLVGLEIIAKEDGRYRNTELSSRCLVPGGDAYQGHILEHRANGWEAWGRLIEAVASGGPVEDLGKPMPQQGREFGEPSTGNGEDEEDQRLRAFILGMDDTGRHSARDMLKLVDVSACEHMLDIGGGPGSYSIAFLEANPRMRATLIDRPKVIEIAREQAAKEGLEDRFEFVAGDLLTDDFGRGYDLVLLSNIVHMLGPEDNEALVRRCADAMESGGLLIIKDFIVDDGRTGPAANLFFALHMLVHTQGGDTYTESEVMGWTRGAGLEDAGMKSLTPRTKLWLAQKP